MRGLAYALIILSISASPAFSCQDGYSTNSLGVCQPDWDTTPPSPQQLLQNIINEAERVGSTINPSQIIKAGFPAADAINQAISSTGDATLIAAVQNIEMLGTKLDTETQNAIKNALTDPSQSVKDIAKAHIKAANDAIDAANASVRYAERTVRAGKDSLSDAEIRLREGKIVDAIWHLGTDRVKSENDNSYALMTESETARQAAQFAVSSTGGPAGSAAFAAWIAYNSSGKNVEKALLAGIYSYAVSTGASEINSMPTKTVSDVVKKAGTAAAMRGLAVAAAGGSREEMVNSAIESGGSVLIQSSGAYLKKEYGDAAQAKADAFCMSAVDETCSDAMQWADDSKKQLEEYKKSIDQYKDALNGRPSVVVTSDGQWAISWNKPALQDRNTEAPALVLSYIGPRSTYREAMLSFKDIRPPPPPPPPVITPSYNINISVQGIFIDDRPIGAIFGHSNTVDFYIDGEYITTQRLNDNFETIGIDLTRGDHIALYKTDVRTETGRHIQAECAVPFRVSGVAVYHPFILFKPVGQRRGTIASCSLTRH